jgi:DNA repair exonuclease SbcCD ATPase subunit
MAKTPDDYNEVMRLLLEMNAKIGSARVLNGGFDRLEKQVEDIAKVQNKLVADFENHTVNDERIEKKIDRLYDPQEGIYIKVTKAETLLTQMNESVERLSEADKKFADQLKSVEIATETTARKMTAIEKISGEDHKELATAIKTTKGFWKFAIWIGAGLLTAVGKLLWDLFVA